MTLSKKAPAEKHLEQDEILTKMNRVHFPKKRPQKNILSKMKLLLAHLDLPTTQSKEIGTPSLKAVGEKKSFSLYFLKENEKIFFHTTSVALAKKSARRKV